MELAAIGLAGRRGLVLFLFLRAEAAARLSGELEESGQHDERSQSRGPRGNGGLQERRQQAQWGPRRRSYNPPVVASAAPGSRAGV